MKIILTIFIALMFLIPTLQAEELLTEPTQKLLETKTYKFDSNKFSIDIPYSWSKIIPKHDGIFASFGHVGYGENVVIVIGDVAKNSTIGDVGWEELFHPFYNAIKFENRNTMYIGDIKATSCVYTSYLDAYKHFSCAFVQNGKLFSLTFADTIENFDSNYPSFQTIVKSIEFY